MDQVRVDEMPDDDAPLPAVREPDWEEEALETIKSMSAGAFETLCQRLLRESGFIQVEVLGRSGDGGIDGRGVVKLGGYSVVPRSNSNANATEIPFRLRRCAIFAEQWWAAPTRA